MAVTLAELVDVVAIATVQCVAAGAAVQRVISVPGMDVIVTALA
nr:hypothetical protein [Verminephrobacter eiseniae]